MRSVALTGNVASGKSTVAGVWRTMGVPVVDADTLAREVVRQGTPGLAEVVAAFGEEVLAPDGTLDREALRARVFTDADARQRLEAILHPRIWEARARWMRRREAEGARLVVAEIPLLFETGREQDFDEVVMVDASTEVRLRRLVGERGMDPEEARRVMASQMDPAAKVVRAQHVIANDGSIEELRREAVRCLGALQRSAGIEPLRMDLHLHTEGSFDCLSPPEAVLARALERGVGRIAVTDHNRLHVAVRMAEAHPGRVIPGEEVKTAEGVDVIGLYLREEIPRGTPAAETVRRIREQGGIPYLPHPYASGKGGGGRLAEELAPLCDVVEVFNGRLHSMRLQERAEALAARHRKLPGAGSDAHTLLEVARTYVEVPEHANTAAALRYALLAARVHGRMSSHLVHLASTWAKVRKRLPGAPDGSDAGAARMV